MKYSVNDIFRSQIQQILKIDRSRSQAHEDFMRYSIPCSQQHFFAANEDFMEEARRTR